MRRLSLVILSLGLLGCVDPDFNRPGLLKAPRILAIQAEPPQPSFGAATTLRALVYQPPPNGDAAECAGGGNPNPIYKWEWCPLPTSSSDGFKCPAKDDQTLALFFAILAQGYPEMTATPPSLSLGSGETATLRNPFPTRLLHDLCTGDVQIPAEFLAAMGLPVMVDAGVERIFSCDKPNYSDPNNQDPLGFPITIRLEYTPPCGSPPQDKYGPTQTAVFTVHLPTDDSLPPNQNPVVGGIFAMFGFDPDAAVPLPPPPDAGAPGIDSGEVVDGGGAIDGGETIDGGAPIDGGTPVADAAAPAPDVVLPPPPDGSVPVGGVPFPRDKRIGLWFDLPLSSSEFLVRPGKLDEVKTNKDNPALSDVFHFERLGFLWFAEAGEFGAQHGTHGRHGGFSPRLNELELGDQDEASLEDGRQAQWALPLVADYAAPTARVVVVVRDSRGGVTWAQGVAPLEMSP